MKITYSSPAKVILSGEHAVVYGKPALVSTINLRLKFSLWEESVKVNDKNILFISKIVKAYLKNQKVTFFDRLFNFKIESEIPIGRGLGSSAALSVACTAAFLEFYTGQKAKKETVNHLAFQIEKQFHQNPSGVDNTAACFGGLILYKKQAGLNSLDYKIPKKIEERLFLIDSGKPKETTGEMVSFVGTKNVAKELEELENVTKKFKESIKEENIILFTDCLKKNEELLEKLEIVSEKTKKLLLSLSNFGSGKVTGAGGKKTNSGFILFFADDSEGLKSYLNMNKIIFYKFISDNKGLKKI